jgi:hypothetical protein
LDLLFGLEIVTSCIFEDIFWYLDIFSLFEFYLKNIIA